MTLHDKDFLIAIADGTATDEERSRYEALRRQDPRIDTYVALLRATRKRIRRAATTFREDVPAELIEQIRSATLRQSRTTIQRFSQLWWIAAAAAAVIIVVLLLPRQSATVDFRAESLQNFELIVTGKLSVAKATNNFNDLVAYFRSHGVKYQLVNIPLKAELVGGVISEHNGVKLAHFVYRRGDTLIYMYQAPEELFQRGILALPATVEPYALSGKWYAENVSQWSWMFWRVQSVYCSVVASVPKDVVANYFIEGVL